MIQINELLGYQVAPESCGSAASPIDRALSEAPFTRWLNDFWVFTSK